jgi:hypothetical protein
MNPSELRSHGEKLYGTRWQNKLAAELPVSTRSIRYWLAGERNIRPVIANRIRALADEAERGRI